MGSACTGRRGLHTDSRTRSSQENAGARRRAQRHRANPQHGSAHGRTAGAHPFRRRDVHSTESPAGVWALGSGHPPAAPWAHGEILVTGAPGPVAGRRRHGHFPGAAHALPDAFYAHPLPEGRFSANFHGAWLLLDTTRTNTCATCGSTMRRDAEGDFRGPSDTRRTSQRASRVKRFVIECFTPRCLVDLASDGELVTNAPPDTVDLIMGGPRGKRAGPRGRRVDTRGA